MAIAISFTGSSSVVSIPLSATKVFTIPSLTTGAGLVVEVAYGWAAGITFTTPTLSVDGAAQSSSVMRQSNNDRGSVFYFWPNVTDASQTFSINNTTASNLNGAAHVWSVTGHDTSAMFGNEVFDTDAGADITVQAAGNGLISAVYGSNSSLAVWSGGGTWGTRRQTTGANACYSNSCDSSSSGTVTVSISGHVNSHLHAVEIKAAGAVGQTLLPASDITATGWTSSGGGALYAAIDETPASDTDYIYTSTLNAECEVKLQSGSTPGSGSLNLKVRLPAGFTPVGTLAVSLYEGTQLIQAFSTGSPAADTVYTYSVTNSITDYTDLRVRIKSGA